MSSKTLSLSHPEIIAEYVRENELKSFFEKRLATPPDHMAMLIRNGQIVDTFKGAHFSIGGIFSKLKSLVVGSTHVSILLADLKPFSVQTQFQAITQDKVPVACTCTLELQIDPDRPENVMGLVNSCGYLTREEVLSRTEPHLVDRVIANAIERVPATEIRGNRGLQDHLQAEIMREVERVVGQLGLQVRACSMEWALNAVEVEEMEQATLDREQQQLDHSLKIMRQNLQRNAEATRFQIEMDVDLEKLKNANEEQLEMMVLNREVRFLDARVQAERRQELEALAHEIDVLRKERAGRFENRLAEADHLIDAANRKLGLTRVHLEIDVLEKTHFNEMKKLGAYTDIEIEERQQMMKLDVAERAQRQQAENMKTLVDIEQTAADREAGRTKDAKRLDADIEMDKMKAEADARNSTMQAAAIMTPEQILAANAGLSPDVAKVLVEQARASGSNSEQVMSMMREMVSMANDARVSSESQAREMFRMGMEGVAGVAHGAGGGKAPNPSTESNQAKSVECGQCGRENEARDRFCVGCGNQLRS